MRGFKAARLRVLSSSAGLSDGAMKGEVSIRNVLKSPIMLCRPPQFHRILICCQCYLL